MLVKKQYVTAALILALLCAFASVLSGCGHLTELDSQTTGLVSEETTVEGYHRITAQKAKEIMESAERQLLSGLTDTEQGILMSLLQKVWDGLL